MKKMLLFPLLGVAAASLTGCGGTASTVLGENEAVVAMIQGTGVAGVEMTISPNEGAVDHPDGCTVDDPGFGCTGSENANTKQINFETNSDASDTPYYLYLDNNTLAAIDVELTVMMNGDEEVSEMVTVPVGGATVYAHIFRNNAEAIQ